MDKVDLHLALIMELLDELGVFDKLIAAGIGTVHVPAHLKSYRSITISLEGVDWKK